MDLNKIVRGVAGKLLWRGRVHHLRMKYASHEREHIFRLDHVPGTSINNLERISGWYLPSPEDNDGHIVISVNGKACFGVIKTYRHDIAIAFPERPRAVESGFIGDLVLPDGLAAGDCVSLVIKYTGGKSEKVLYENMHTIKNSANGNRVRKTEFSLDDILLDDLEPDTNIYGAPHFHDEGRLPVIRLTESGSTHPYSDKAQVIIDGCDGLVLDFGAGIQTRERLRGHVVNLDAIHFPYVDVVNTRPTLPFRDSVFDAVISQAVFEHVSDPFESMREIRRVLKDRGRVLIDTAFMQPFHGDPDHYFNMTKSGLREIMAGFEIEELGVRPYQNPSYGLNMQIESVLPFIQDRRWRNTFKSLHRQLKKRGDSLDSSLGETGREIMAAGVYVMATKVS